MQPFKCQLLKQLFRRVCFDSGKRVSKSLTLRIANLKRRITKKRVVTKASATVYFQAELKLACYCNKRWSFGLNVNGQLCFLAQE